MTVPTATDLTLIRSRPHSGKIWFSIYKPTAVFVAQVSGTNPRGTFEVPYCNVIVGNYTTVVSGMTMLIGTSPGARDRGKIRIRDATSEYIKVAENYHIDWTAGLYLTIVDFHEVWPVFPRMTTDEGNTTWYKDYDIEYVNQNSLLGSFINMGPHHAGFISGAVAEVFFTASGTSNLLGDSLLYYWQFPGGDPTWFSGTEPGFVSYNVPGHYTSTLRVTTGNGVEEYGYRHISIYDRPGQGSAVPILRWGLSSFEGSRSNGGWSARVWVRDNISDVVDGALCVFFTDSQYGDNGGIFGGNATNRSSILFVGYVDGETIHYDWEKSYVDFDIVSITGLMKELECFSVALNSAENPNYWYEMLDLDARRAVYHYLKWQTTVLEIADVDFKNFEDRKIQYFDGDKTSLYDAVSGFIQSTLLGEVVADRQGRIYIEQEAGIIPDASGTVPTNMIFDHQDWMGEPTFGYKDHDRINYIEAGGIAYSGVVTGTWSAFLAGAPGAYVPRYGGISQNISGLALDNQEQLNELAGDLLAWRGSKLGEVEIALSGDFRNIDIAPQEQIPISLDSGDTVRGFVWRQKPFIVSRMNGKYNPRQQSLMWDISVRELTKGLPGSMIEIPEVPPNDWPDPPWWPIPPIPPIPYPPTPDQEVETVYVAGYIPLDPLSGDNHVFHLGRTDNFQDKNPTWRNVKPDFLSGTGVGCFNDFCVDPFDSQHSAYFLSDDAGICYLTDLDTLNPQCTVLLSPAEIQASMRSYGGGHADEEIVNVLRIKANPYIPGYVVVTICSLSSLGGYNRAAWIFTRTSYSASWGRRNLIDATLGRMFFPSTIQSTGINAAGLDIMGGDYEYPIFVACSRNQYTWTSEVVMVADAAGNCKAAFVASGYKEPSCVHIPRCPGAQNRIVWVGGGRGTLVDAYVQRSIDFGVSWNDKTPTFIHGYGDGGGHFSRTCDIKTYYGDYSDVLAFVSRSYAKEGTEATHLISSKDHGNTWSLIKTFTRKHATSEHTLAVRCLERHPFDPDKIYCVGNADDGYILASSNRGKTWNSKLGNWYSVFGQYPVKDAYYNPCFIYPVW